MPEIRERGAASAEGEVAGFLSGLRASPEGDLFEAGRRVVAARAPGRLDVMGGIADYSGSLVLQWPIREATLAAVQSAGGPGLTIVSRAIDEGHPARRLEIDGPTTRELLDGGYEAARRWLSRDPEAHWASYVVGVLAVLHRERGLTLGVDRGLRVLVESKVPEGKGVSSSAALEVAVMQAAAGLLGESIEGTEVARLCQMAENFVVGAPCGIMDQMASAVAKAGSLLALLCQPAEVKGYVDLPPAIGFWGIDSGIRHAVTGSDYTSVRTGAFMGYRMIAEAAGLQASATSEPGVVAIDDPRWSGFVANLTPAEFDREFASKLPATLAGAEFLGRFGGTTDRVTRVDPSRTYAVLKPTAHPIGEHARVRRFAELLSAHADEAALREMGELMFGSHASYSSCGLGSDGTDLLVEMVREAGPARGLYGAKITGGGSGGTVAILGRADAGPAVADIARRYAAETGRTPYLFEGTSPGACHFGTRSTEG
ncbi:Galactokinase [Aquisphaera giovannonii]|uniref:Galactokinase n=1 Tax=Aquisphaera giovannonii TaxID=406548 RepID=A0A5B9W594_9BACT|nr:GHMP kinase [Aquisphaera giovannonii]QEH35733.1 Galactokinase [Aquisphaera giovannonii]